MADTDKRAEWRRSLDDCEIEPEPATEEGKLKDLEDLAGLQAACHAIIRRVTADCGVIYPGPEDELKVADARNKQYA